jgi:hypothetical protein
LTLRSRFFRHFFRARTIRIAPVFFLTQAVIVAPLAPVASQASATSIARARLRVRDLQARRMRKKFRPSRACSSTLFRGMTDRARAYPMVPVDQRPVMLGGTTGRGAS